MDLNLLSLVVPLLLSLQAVMLECVHHADSNRVQLASPRRVCLRSATRTADSNQAAKAEQRHSQQAAWKEQPQQAGGG
jgi:hypothetical protein